VIWMISLMHSQKFQLYMYCKLSLCSVCIMPMHVYCLTVQCTLCNVQLCIDTVAMVLTLQLGILFFIRYGHISRRQFEAPPRRKKKKCAISSSKIQHLAGTKCCSGTRSKNTSARMQICGRVAAKSGGLVFVKNEIPLPHK
jgi:hypothetical protein